MTKLDVINMALDSLGRDAIHSSSAEGLAVSKRAGRWYKTAALYVLNYANWIDAVENTTLTSEAAITNVWNDYWEYVYAQPTDCLRVLDLELDDRAQYIVQNGYIYTNLYNSSTGINCRYIKDIREGTTLEYSDLLGEVIATRLAYNPAPVKEKGAFLGVFNDILFEALKVNEMSDTWVHGHENPLWADADTRKRRKLYDNWTE